MPAAEFWSLCSILAAGIVLPPGLNVVLLLVGGWLILGARSRSARVAGASCIALSGTLLYVLSAGVTANRVIALVQSAGPPALTEVDIEVLMRKKPHAVVVLTGGISRWAPEHPGHMAPTDASWIRLLYAEDLALRLEVPLVISGKGPISGVDEASVIAGFSRRLRSTNILVESTSTNTSSAGPALRRTYPHLRNIVLVSDVAHLVRAAPLFARAGLHVTPAPTRFVDVGEHIPRSFIPSARKLAEAHAALHAALGYIVDR